MLYSPKNCSPAIKEALYRHPGISRTQLAELLGITTPSIGPYVSQLLADKVIQESKDNESEKKGAGRRQVQLNLVPEYGFVVGIEIGAYNTAICIANLVGRTVYSNLHERAPINYNDMIENISSIINDSISSSSIPKEKILGVSIGIPGYVEKEKGIIHIVPDHMDWNNQPLIQDLSERTGLAVTIENNTRSRAVAAELFLTTPELSYFAYLFVSRGIACPVIVNGTDISRKTAGAGEIGYTVVQYSEDLSSKKGNEGRLFDVSSEIAIRTKCRKMMEENPDTILNTIVASPDMLEMNHIMYAFENDDPSVTKIMNDAIMHLGYALGNVINVINPEKVFIDAYIMKCEKSRELMKNYIFNSLKRLNATEISLEFLDYSPYRGAIGSCADALKTFFINA